MEVKKTFWPSRTRIRLAIIAALAISLFLFRMAAPIDLIDFGQEMPTAYTLDVIHNGHWLVQWDNDGVIASKPPLHTWLAALASLMLGGVSRWTLCLPSAAATLGTAVTLFTIGRRRFGESAGFAAAFVFLLSASTLKAIILVRVDAVFAFGVALAALAAFRAWESGAGWIAAWVVAAFVTLTKGPLGVVLAFVGLLAVLWERKSGHAHPMQGSHWKGVVLFFAIVGGWLLLAWHKAGSELFDKLFDQELVHHAITNGVKERPGQHPYYPFLYFLSRFAPWSLLSCVGFWRVLRHPAADASERRFERFLFCWFFVGLVLFSATPHQRGDLLWPLFPAAALLAGREAARFTQRWSQPRLALALGIAAVLTFAFGAWDYFDYRSNREALMQARSIDALADTIRAPVRDGLILTPVNVSPYLHLRLGTFAPNVSAEAAARLLAGPDPAFVVVNDARHLRARLGPKATLHVLAEGSPTRFTHLQLVSNSPKPEIPDTQAALIGNWYLRLTGVRHLHGSRDDFVLESRPGTRASVVVHNQSERTNAVRIAFKSGVTTKVEQKALPAGGEYTFTGSN